MRSIQLLLLSFFLVDATSEARRFTQFLRDTWNFQKCDNNIVIFISRDDRKVYTMAGRTAYKTLTLECIEAVYNRVRPTLKAGRYQDALEAMLTDYKSVLQKEDCGHFVPEEMSGETTLIIVLCSVFGGLFVIGCSIFLCCKCGCCSGGSGGSGRSYWSRDYHYSSDGCGGGGGGGGFFSGGEDSGGGGGGGGDF